ncbi:MAG TPA: SDR family NAD(P)-dependent oxidoreductase [Steroidobacteraceae bacterium]|nr:SDR family NAD(P)-dependent oxidoreductase [Steroidobacteraceae bacterium]
MITRRIFLAGIHSLLALASMAAPAADDTVDMRGRTALVTGSTSGLGEVVARRLGAMGATVIVHGLNEQRGREIAAEITARGPGRAVYEAGDLASLDEVRALARRVRAAHPRLHLLVNNAGIGGAGSDARRESADGHELVFQVNYLSHFLLTRELLPALEAGAPARIVNVASIGQRAINFDDVMMRNGYQTAAAYSQSKLAQIMFTITLAGMLDPARVTVNALHPATFMNTPMVIDAGRQPMSSVEDGADAVMQLAVGAALTGRSGLYFNQKNEARANQQAYDAAARKRLWDLSTELIGSR